MASKNIPVNGWPQLKDLEAVQPILNRLDKIEAWKRTVKEETFTGEEITIPNALALPARSLITEINAIQDLHGYDKPWAGGAGKNKLNYDVWKTVGIIGGSATWENNGVTLTATANDCYTRFLENDYPVGARIPITNGQKITVSWKETTNKHGIVAIFPNASMTGLVTVDNANAKQLTYTAKSGDTFITFRFGVTNSGDTISYEDIQFEYGDTATSYAPYSNLCPISGRTAVAVDDVGKNLYNNEVGTSSDSGITYTKNADGTIKATGTASANSYYNMTNVVFPAGTYAFNGCPSGGADNKYKISLFNVTTQQTIGTGDTGSGNTFTANGTDEYRLFIRVNNGYAFPTDGLLFKPMVRLADIADDTYEPYQHSSATIQLGTTVYGADINWDTGVMTVKTAKRTYTAVNNKLNNAYRLSPNSTTDMLIENTDSQLPADTFISDKYKFYAIVDIAYPTSTVIGGVAISKTSNGIYVSDPNMVGMTVEEASAYVAANPIDIGYTLATPTTIQLTPEQLQMLKGYNRITLSDGYGTIELKALTGANWS